MAKVTEQKIGDLTPDTRNANKGTQRGRGLLEKSLRQYGAGRSILLDKNGRIIAGNKTSEVAGSIGLEDVIIVESDGTKLVAVKRTDLDLDSDEARMLAYADNQVGAVSLDFDPEVLQFDITSGLPLDEFFTLPELREIGITPEPKGDTEAQIDKAEELREKWNVESGQLWQLGEHRVICGDCTDAAVVERVMGGEICEALIYDPEWDASQKPQFVNYSCVLAFCDGATFSYVIDLFGLPSWVFAWDCVSSWYTPNRPLRRMKNCLFFGDITKYKFDGAHYGEPGESRMVWNTRGEYKYIADPRGKHLADVYQNPITKLHANSFHSHSKPIEWIQMLIANCTLGNIFDPFLGSGTTLIACENLSRKCRGIEISPAYVAVTLERWHQHTGKMPELLVSLEG